MNWTLEVVVVPVSDIDRAKAFYADQLGFTVDHDTRIGDGQRVVQLTPPGSGCSIVIGEGVCPTCRPVRCAACTWWWPTSLRRTPSSPSAASRSAR